MEPLIALLRKGVNFQWGKEQEETFASVKDPMRHYVFLTVFDATLPTVVTTDASDYGLSAVLQQIHPEGIHAISFTLQILSSTECNYSTEEKVALACLWACEEWHIFVFGRNFTLKTNHQHLLPCFLLKDLVDNPSE